jgi:hypothetical protein
MLADTASGQQALFATPGAVRRILPAETGRALHRLIAELTLPAAPRPARNAQQDAVRRLGHPLHRSRSTIRASTMHDAPESPDSRIPLEGIRTVLISRY